MFEECPLGQSVYLRARICCACVNLNVVCLFELVSLVRVYVGVVVCVNVCVCFFI